MTKNYTTYATINEAFNNGSGDVFFKNESGFLCVSRHSVNYDEMQAAGFTHVPHAQVLEIAAQQAPAVPVEPIKPTPPAAPKKFVNYPDMEVQGFYDEFPDAYGQNL
jgi:hypothetical protein